MSKADNLHLSGTTKKRIGKKEVPASPKTTKVSKPSPPLVVEQKEKDKQKLKKTNVELREQLHFHAKVTAMELGKSMKSYIADLIAVDLKKRGKI